jgi:hypothetical protein
LSISHFLVRHDPFLRDGVDRVFYSNALHIETIWEESDRRETQYDRYDDHELDEGKSFFVHTNSLQERLSAW